MPRVGFEPTTPAFERAELVHALDHAASVIGVSGLYWAQNKYSGEGPRGSVISYKICQESK
jgi:hypothetical protein